jgi:hypothetical protein
MVYYDSDSAGRPIRFDEADLSRVIDEIASGKLRSKNSRNIIERFALVGPFFTDRGTFFIFANAPVVTRRWEHGWNALWWMFSRFILYSVRRD